MPGLVVIPNAAHALSLAARPGCPPSRQRGRAFPALAVRPARAKRPEMAPLKVSDIDSQRMTLRVEQGKGQRDRYVRHCHVGGFYLLTARSGHRPQTGKSMAWRAPAWYWTPPESAILGQRDNAHDRRRPAFCLATPIALASSRAPERKPRGGGARFGRRGPMGI